MFQNINCNWLRAITRASAATETPATLHKKKYNKKVGEDPTAIESKPYQNNK